MRTIHRLIEAKKAQREEEGNEAGFSLIELIIVVVILGILVAIAIPLIGNISNQAKISAAKAAAQNAAVQWSSQIAAGGTATVYNTNDANLFVGTGAGPITANAATAVTDPNLVCATATNATITGTATYRAGPGC